MSKESPQSILTSPLIVTVVAIILTFLATQLGGCWERRYIRQQESNAVKTALTGEIIAIHIDLKRRSENLIQKWKDGPIPPKLTVTYPHAIFDANVGSLGKIHDHTLLSILTTLYSTLNSFQLLVEEFNNDPSKVNYAKYGCSLLFSWKLSIILQGTLRAQLRDYEDKEWQVIPEVTFDKADLELIDKSLTEINDYLSSQLKPSTLS